jgi:hypothetical protein
MIGQLSAQGAFAGTFRPNYNNFFNHDFALEFQAGFDFMTFL